ncbi:N2227-like protein-domain-containing protein [Geopyxis carbonaria]|nr:N2227-like protein-domain-containing protein [Geopyxis carbonaria]
MNHPQDPRYQLMGAMVGFWKYKRYMEKRLEKKSYGYKYLSANLNQYLAPIDYPAKIATTASHIATNDIVARAIVSHALEYYQISEPELQAFYRHYHPEDRRRGWHVDTVLSLRHIIRDWSADGLAERTETFPPLLALLPPGTQHILVPGAGLGRLAYELAARGHSVIANEFSYPQLLALHYMLSLAPGAAGMQTYYPNINNWSHQRTTDALFHASTFPDAVPLAPAVARMRIVERDFLWCDNHCPPRGNKKHDVVVTLFFIDTAENLLLYLEKIRSALKPGGRWINLGPLKYGTAPKIELSLDELLIVAENMGFELQPLATVCGDRRLSEGEQDPGAWGTDSFPDSPRWRGKVRENLAGYGWDRQSLSRNAYLSQLWVADLTAQPPTDE